MSELKVGILVADNDEYNPFCQEIKKFLPKKYSYYKKSAVSFEISNNKIICINCGIGKVNAAAAAAHLADFGCDIILNFGLSGGIHGVRRNDIIFPTRFLEHDFDLTGIGYKPCEKPGQDYIYDADKSLLSAAEKIGIIGGTAVCGDRFICSESDRDFLNTTFGADSCDMETAAIASVCHMTDIPFAALRRISDDAGETAVDSYREMNANNGRELSAIFLDYLIKVCRVFGKS